MSAQFPSMILEAPDLSLATFAAMAAVMMCAGFARGYAGFGSSAVIMAALTLILPPAELVPIAAAMEVAASSVQLRGVRHHIDGRVLVLIASGAIIGTPIGVYALTHLPAEETKFALLAIILSISLVLVLRRGKARALPLTTPVLSGMGVASGIVGGLAAVGGLVLAVTFTAGEMPVARMRAVLIAFFFVVSLWSAALLYAAGLLDATAAARALIALPFLTLGIVLGSRRFLSASPQSFRTIVLFIVIGLCAIGLLKLAFA